MDLPYPNYLCQANGPDETGLTLSVYIENGAGGPLPGLDGDALMQYVRDHLAAQADTTVYLSRSDITGTNL